MNTEEVSISDMFGSYPEISDPLFNTLLSRKKEFSELEPSISERPPRRGGRYKHQMFAIRYATWYSRCAFFHDPGTGKSCIIAGIAELFKDEYRKNPEDLTRINKAIILVRGETLEENIRNEIVCKCTDRVYETEMVLRATNETTMKGNITRELNKWYEIMSYGDFAKLIGKMQRSEDIEEYMSNKAIFVDEAHNIATVKDILNVEDPDEDDDAEGETDVGQETIGTDNTTYQTIFRAFHRGRRNKIFLFTASPMINGPREFPFLMNLILPLQDWPGQMPFWTDTQFETLTVDQIEPYLRGRVSYIRALDTGAREVNPPGSAQIPGHQTWIYPCDMSAFQYAAYLRAGQSTTGARRQAFYGNQRQASNFVFPDGTWGKSGARKYIEYRDGRYQYKQDQNGVYLQQLLRVPEGLQTLSSKYAEIVRICREAYPNDRLNIQDHQGIIFIYFPVYVNGSGSVMCGKALEENGYEEYRETTNIFSGSTDRQSGPCGSYNVTSGTERESRLQKRPRFASLTYRTTSPQINSIFNTLKSYENRYGELIQVMMVSRVGQEGISIDHAVGEIMTSSSWNFARQFQAKDRIFRSTSHEVRLEEKRRRMLARGEDPTNATFDVRIYNMSAIYRADPQATEEILRQTDTNTIDTRMFLLSELKNRAIRKVIRFCKESSIDCHINYRRNVRPTDVNGSPTCDYMDCTYECRGIRRDLLAQTDRTTKILFYSDTEVAGATEAIKNLFSRFSSLKIGQIHTLIPEIDKIFIDMALEQMIRENIRVVGRMGFFGYLREAQDSEGTIYLESDPFTLKAVPENTAYTSDLIGTQDPRNNIFADYITNLESLSQAPQLEELLQMGRQEQAMITDSSGSRIINPRFAELLENLALSNKVILLEFALLQRVQTRMTSDFGSAVISSFNYSIFEMKEPVGLLQQTASALANRGKGRGRKPNPNTKVKSKGLKTVEATYIPFYDPNAPTETVIVHTLLNQAFDRVSYNTVSKYFKAEGELRILKLSEGIGWRDLNQYEQVVYNDLVKRQIQAVKSYYERFPIYGIMLPPMNRFWIRDSANEDQSKAEGDARFVRRARVCNNWDKPELINLLYRLGLALTGPGNEATNLTRPELINFLNRQKISPDLINFPNDKLVFFYNWYRTNLGKEGICRILQEHLQRTGMMFTGKIPTDLLNRPPETGPSSGSIQVIPDTTPATPGQTMVNQFSNLALEDILADIPTEYDEE